MPTDYAQIREENIRRYGTETAHLALLGDLYSERTHFIFELLQNAEDAKATQLRFRLGPASLELCHNGRLFTPDDVGGISSICQSTNEGDPERIGRFGIGFKSVYAYTRRPEIHSGEEHFAIDHYVRPEAAPPRHADDISTTLIVLPFDAASVAVSDARSEIQAAFTKLDPINLLFLRHIQTVELFTDGSQPTSLVRKLLAQLAPQVRVLAISSSDARVQEQRWLVFERTVNFTTPAARQLALRVEAAFSLSTDSAENHLTILPRDRATLAVFFPTSRPTATSFIIQGPFIPTPDRSNVRERNPLNIRLANEAAELVVEALRWLRDKGALSKATLATLPLRRIEFSSDSLFRPLFDRVLQALKEERLLPACGATPQEVFFVNGQNAKAASSAELRELLTPTLLADFLAGSNWQWLADDLTVHGDSDLARYLHDEVGINEVTAGDLVAWLETKETLWWESLQESWLVRLYRYLHAQTAEHSRLKKLPIVRLENGQHASAATQPIFFRAANPHEAEELAPFLPTLPVARQSLLVSDADKVVESFLRQMGVAPLVASEFIKRHVIPRYEAKPFPTAAENRSHIRFLKRVVHRMSPNEINDLLTILKNLAILICRKTSDPTHSYFVKPSNAYIPCAYSGDHTLELFFQSSPDTWFVDPAYFEPTEETIEWKKLMLQLGAGDSPRVTESDQWNRRDRHIDGLESALAALSTCPHELRAGLASAIWSVVTRLLPGDGAYAQYGWDQFLHGHQDIFGPRGGYHGSRETDASFFLALREKAWLLDAASDVHRPSELIEDTKFNRELLGETAFYLHKQFTLKNQKEEWLASKLEIRRFPTKESALVQLKALKTAPTSLTQTRTVYEFLDRIRADVGSSFEQEGLVFCPSPEPRWLKPSQAFWDDESVVFGNTRGYLQKHYPELRDFFLRAGVGPSAGPTDYAAVLMEIAQTGLADEPTRTRIRRICKRLGQRFEEGGSWQDGETWKIIWTRLREGAHWLAILADGFGFHRLNRIVRVDNDHLATLFSGKLPFWPFRDLNDFAAQHLAVIGCSSASCRLEPVDAAGLVEGYSDELKMHWPFIVAFLHSDKWKPDCRENTVAAIAGSPPVRQASRIAVTYTLMGVEAEEPGGKSAFFDAQNGVLWLVRGLDADDSTEAIGDALQESFGPEVLREFVCDLFRKGQNRSVEKWRKKGLMLSQQPSTEPTTQETDQRSSIINEAAAPSSADAPQPIVVESAKENPQEAAPHEPITQHATPIAQVASVPGDATPGLDTPNGPSFARKGQVAGTPLAQDQAPILGATETGSDQNATSRDSTGASALPTQQAPAPTANADESGSASPAKDVKQALQEAFNKQGKTSVTDDRPESGSVRNPTERRTRTRETYAARKNHEPAPAQRVAQRVIDVWDPKNKAIRDFLYEEYAGRCQICGETNRFPRRDGKAYFEAVYLIPHTEAAWTDEPGSVVCLCALCSAKFQHGSVECENIAAQIRSQKAAVEGGSGKPLVSLKLVGKPVTLTFSERHLIELQELLAIADPDNRTTLGADRPLADAEPTTPIHGPNAPPSPPPQESGPPTVELVRCPRCNPSASLVRKDKLQRHIAKVHERLNASSGSYTPFPKTARTLSGLRRCRACGNPVVPGEDYCYAHM
jgi:hypothetical protein